MGSIAMVRKATEFNAGASADVTATTRNTLQQGKDDSLAGACCAGGRPVQQPWAATVSEPKRSIIAMLKAQWFHKVSHEIVANTTVALRRAPARRALITLAVWSQIKPESNLGIGEPIA
jgi:hypothetical protein